MAKKPHEKIQQIGSTQPKMDLKNIDQKKILKPHKLIRIAVSGDVLLTEMEKEIIDKKSFQRLRKLKQLGSTYLVFPTAIHTRFDHSLGALQMVKSMIDSIRENKHNDEGLKENEITFDEEILARLLALLHDIGHIPFGHTIEDEFCIFPRHDEDENRMEKLVGKKSEIGSVILEYVGSDLYERFYKLITFDKKNDPEFQTLGNDAVIYDLVNNTVCADLLDYLKRDHFFCNLPLGLEYRFLNFIYVYFDKANQTKRVAIRLWKNGQTLPRVDLLDELVSLLEYRYKIGAIAYFHKAKLISGSMLAGAVLREKLFNPSFTKEFLFDKGDEELIYILKSSSNPIVRKLINSFDDRVLWKEVCQKTNYDVIKEDSNDSTLNYREVYKETIHKNAENRYKIEQEIATNLGMEDGDFLFHSPNPKMQLKYAEMKVFWKGSYEELKNCEGASVELIRKKLQNILESHENLFAIRGYVNPIHTGQKQEIQIAFDKFLCFNVNHKAANDKEYAKTIVPHLLDELFETAEISHAAYEKFENSVVDRYLQPTDAIRDRDFLVQIANEEAGKFNIESKSESNQS